MSNLAVIESVLMKGDLSALNPAQKLEYYSKVCESVGLNPLTKPFEYMRLSNKEVLYATKGATEQLRNIHKISIKVVAREKIEDVYVVTAEAMGADGRCDSATGAVAIAGLKGESLANAFMKAETKAKRRVTLSICGLNMLDETEVESIPTATKQVTSFNSQPVAPMVENKKLDAPASVEAQFTQATEAPQETFDQFVESSAPAGYPKVALDPNYVITFGTHKGKTIEAVGIDVIGGYVGFLEKKAKNEGKSIQGQVLTLIQQYEARLK